jgi:DNA-binding XRE family transcriptional regulator
MVYGQAEVLSRTSNSPLADVYKTTEFKNEWANDVRFHVARNLLHLRRHREWSQDAVAKATKTSQSAIARIESGQENMTLDTLQRLVVALNGRFQISIQPQEYFCCLQRPWWEIGDSGSGWTVVGVMARRGTQTDQVIIGAERPHTQSFSAGTLTPESLAGLPTEAKTN